MQIAKKKYTLSMDTTSKICSISLSYKNNIIDEINIDNGLNHSITLFTSIDKIFKNNNLSITDIDKIKVSNGPGSFTGIRIGIACALGLSAKHNTKIEYIDTLDSLANNIKGSNDIIISLIDAKVNRAFIAFYNGKTLEKYSNDIIIDIDYLINELNTHFQRSDIKFSLVGDATINYKATIDKNLNIKYQIFDKDFNMKASSLINLTGIISDTPIINYLLASKAERDRDAKH